jgi:hypothetical protein
LLRVTVLVVFGLLTSSWGLMRFLCSSIIRNLFLLLIVIIRNLFFNLSFDSLIDIRCNFALFAHSSLVAHLIFFYIEFWIYLFMIGEERELVLFFDLSSFPLSSILIVHLSRSNRLILSLEFIGKVLISLFRIYFLIISEGARSK